MDDSIIDSVEYYDYRPLLSKNFNDVGIAFPRIVYNEDIVSQLC